MAVAGIVQAEPRVRRSPVLEHANQAAGGEVLRDGPLAAVRQASAAQRGVDHQVVVVERQRAGDIDLELLAALLELPVIVLYPENRQLSPRVRVLSDRVAASMQDANG